MTVIRATCPDCGDVRTDVGHVTLRFISETEFEGAEYRFVCPECHKIVLKPASHETAVLLYSSGVAVERYEPPLEIMERPPEDEGQVITLDDVLDLCLALEQDEEGWIEKMKNRGSNE